MSYKNNSSLNNENKNVMAVTKEASLETKDSHIHIGYKNLKLTSSLKKEVKDNPKDSLCSSWNFNEEALKGLLTSMKKVSGQEAYKYCYQYPCWYKGVVSNDSLEYEITIYGGGYLTLKNKDEILHFITKNESQLFISICDCCED